MFDNIDKVNDVNFLWCFTNHRIDWDKIYEPNSDFNKSNKIPPKVLFPHKIIHKKKKFICILSNHNKV